MCNAKNQTEIIVHDRGSFTRWPVKCKISVK